MCNIGEVKRIVNVEPLVAPAPVPGHVEEPEPVYVEAQEPVIETVNTNS